MRGMGRAAGVLSVAVVVGALLTAVPAAASGTPLVTFAGGGLLGLPLLTCASQPDRSALSLRAGDPLDIANGTGHGASFFVNGVRAAENAHLDAGSTVQVSFPAGTWTLTLVPDCLLNISAAGALTADVSGVATPPMTPPPPPSSPSSRPSPGPPTNTAAPSPTATPPSTVAPVGGPTGPHAASPTSTIGAHGTVAPLPGTTRGGAAAGSTNGPLIGEPVPIPDEPGGGRPVNALLVLVAAVCVLGVALAGLGAIATRRRHRSAAGVGPSGGLGRHRGVR